jgi:hypothetical protein
LLPVWDRLHTTPDSKGRVATGDDVTMCGDLGTDEGNMRGCHGVVKIGWSEYMRGGISWSLVTWVLVTPSLQSLSLSLSSYRIIESSFSRYEVLRFNCCGSVTACKCTRTWRCRYIQGGKHNVPGVSNYPNVSRYSADDALDGRRITLLLGRRVLSASTARTIRLSSRTSP